MTVVIRGIKVLLVVAGLAWAAWVSSIYIAFARAFAPVFQGQPMETSALGTVEGYGIAFGPLVVAICLLFIRWPLKRKSTTPNRGLKAG